MNRLRRLPVAVAAVAALSAGCATTTQQTVSTELPLPIAQPVNTTPSSGPGQGSPRPTAGGQTPSVAEGVWQRVDPIDGHTEPEIDGQRNFGYQRLANSPAAPNVMYLGSFNRGLWKSADSGATWRKVNTGENGEKLDTGRLWAVAVDPTNADVVYTTDGYGGHQGLWKSVDGGVNWQQMLPTDVVERTSPSIYSIAINPTDPQHLLLGSHQPWGYPASAGLLESRDGGRSWKVHEPFAEWGWGHNIMFVNSETWLLGTQDSGYWRTTDSGESWTQVSKVNMQHGGTGLLITPRGVLYMGAANTVLRSTDQGASWRKVGPETPDGYYTVGSDGTYLYIQRSNTGDSVSEPSPFYISPIDDGITWQPQPGGQTFDNGPFDLLFDPTSGVMVASNWLGGVWRLTV